MHIRSCRTQWGAPPLERWCWLLSAGQTEVAPLCNRHEVHREASSALATQLWGAGGWGRPPKDEAKIWGWLPGHAVKTLGPMKRLHRSYSPTRQHLGLAEPLWSHVGGKEVGGRDSGAAQGLRSSRPTPTLSGSSPTSSSLRAGPAPTNVISPCPEHRGQQRLGASPPCPLHCLLVPTELHPPLLHPSHSHHKSMVGVWAVVLA